MERVEITDLIAEHPVRRDDVANRLRASGQERAARLVEALPASDGVLDAEHCRALMRRIHAELQRLAEEFQLARRVAEDVATITRTTPAARLIDVGCGAGHVLRSLARSNALPGVELVATDLNSDLVEMGRELARLDNCRVRFEVADALDVAADGPPTILMSTGLLHHLSPDRLASFMARHEQRPVLAFLHYDPEPGWLTNLGSWLFHLTRMREPISRHDGNLSMRRAYPAERLRAIAARSAPSFSTVCVGGQSPLRVWRPLIGVRRC